jgi:capsular polysaccharide biosynthesis protein
MHRLLALILGFVFRSVARVGLGDVPLRATSASRITAAREPDSVTLLSVGPAEILRRVMPPGTPPRHPIFAAGLSVEVPETYLLEIRDGLVVGDFGAHVTPGRTLDYETSGYFGLASWREHPIFLRPRVPRIEELSGTALSLVTRGASSNYYHFLFDVLPRLGVFEEAMPGRQVDAVIVPHATGYQKQLLELVGCPGPWVQPSPSKSYRAHTLLVPSTPNQDLPAPHASVAWLRSRLRPTDATSGPALRIYITRGDKPRTRRYLQEAELVAELARRGFIVLDPGAHSVREQIDLFSRAEMIVSPHGAGLSNVVFARDDVRVLELFASDYVHLGLWSICTALADAEYRYIVAEGTRDPEHALTGVLTDVDIPATRVLAEVDEMLADLG